MQLHDHLALADLLERERQRTAAEVRRTGESRRGQRSLKALQIRGLLAAQLTYLGPNGRASVAGGLRPWRP
jgi:hypothetical protein